jgi:hypothetical protein
VTHVLIPLEFIATFTAALFAGAGLCINIAEHPARMTLDTRFAAAQWALVLDGQSRVYLSLALDLMPDAAYPCAIPSGRPPVPEG